LAEQLIWEVKITWPNDVYVDAAAATIAGWEVGVYHRRSAAPHPAAVSGWLRSVPARMPLEPPYCPHGYSEADRPSPQAGCAAPTGQQASIIGPG
jgi:hypothetical protein